MNLFRKLLILFLKLFIRDNIMIFWEARTTKSIRNILSKIYL